MPIPSPDLDPDPPTPLSPSERTLALSIFQSFISYFESHESNNTLHPTRGYKRSKLLALVHEYASTDLGRDNILQYFLRWIFAPKNAPSAHPAFPDILTSLPNFNSRSASEKNEVVEKAQDLADHLVANFFLPLRAFSTQTHHQTPIPQQETSPGHPPRLSSLQEECLLRDHHRCVISHRFDAAEEGLRFKKDGETAVDDDGQLLLNTETEDLVVAHIIPPALASNIILSLLDPSITHLISSSSSSNALTLSVSLHPRFARLGIYFEADASAESDHTYVIRSTCPYAVFQPTLPTTRQLFPAANHNIDAPMPRLLAIHRACGLILYMSGADTYINKVLQDMELGVKSDGTTELGSLVSLGLSNFHR